MRLYGKLLLSMIAAGALALIVLALMLNWRLGQGFVDYINDSDAERLPTIAAALAEHYRDAGDWRQLHRRPRQWRGILARARDLEEPEIAPTSPAVRTTASRQRRASRGHESWSPLWARLSVYDRSRQRVIGRYDYEESGRRLPVVVDAETVGWVGLHELMVVRSRVAERFLEGQRRGLLLASLAMLLILSLSAALLARNWSRPIQRIAGVTRRLASGDFEARVHASGRDEIAALGGDIDFLAHSLGQADAVRKRWMADTAHELRTPLAILKGELEALQDGIRPLDQDAIASLASETAHLGALIEELRELALADVGALDYRMETVDLAELVRDCLEGNAGRLAQAGLTASADLPGCPVRLRGDARRLRQLLENLIENSLRYTDPGGRLRIVLREEQQRIDLGFDDSEPGVPDELLPQLFEPFVRGSGDGARATRGSGLGLAICRRIVEAHGGGIEAFPSSLGGLSLRMLLPASTAIEP